MDLAPLQQSLGVQIHLLDMRGLFLSAIADPSQYGLTNVTDMAINPSLNGNGYLFWDQEHPTTAVDQIIGGIAAQSAPEPSSLLLLGTSICGLAVVIRLRSRSTASPQS